MHDCFLFICYWEEKSKNSIALFDAINLHLTNYVGNRDECPAQLHDKS